MSHIVTETCNQDVPFLDDCEGGTCTWCSEHQARVWCPKHAEGAGLSTVDVTGADDFAAASTVSYETRGNWA